RPPPLSTRFPYTTLFRSVAQALGREQGGELLHVELVRAADIDASEQGYPGSRHGLEVLLQGEGEDQCDDDAHRPAGAVLDGEDDRIVMHLASMRLQPHATDPV